MKALTDPHIRVLNRYWLPQIVPGSVLTLCVCGEGGCKWEGRDDGPFLAAGGNESGKKWSG